MSFIQIITLAFVQGITEFLPISSSGHLILGFWVMLALGFEEVVDWSFPVLFVLFFFVTDFAINRTRNLYNGTITVVGFVRSDGLIAASPDQG